jgi:hypothetical protein
MCSSTFSTALSSMSGPRITPGSVPLPTLSARTFSASLAANASYTPSWHVDPVGADARLAVVAVLRDDGARGGGVEVRIVEHDEGRVAAELQAQLLHRVGALAHETPARPRSSRER